jgi:hypothetical protein
LEQTWGHRRGSHSAEVGQSSQTGIWNDQYVASFEAFRQPGGKPRPTAPARPRGGQEPAESAAAPVQAVTIGDLIRDGKLLEVHCALCRPERHLYLNPELLRLRKRMPMPKSGEPSGLQQVWRQEQRDP